MSPPLNNVQRNEIESPLHFSMTASPKFQITFYIIKDRHLADNLKIPWKLKHMQVWDS